MTHSYEIFGHDLGSHPPVSYFQVRITPPIVLGPAVTEMLFQPDQMELYASTATATVIQIEAPGSIHKDATDPEYSYQEDELQYSGYRSHEERTHRVVQSVGSLIELLDGISDPMQTDWTEGVQIDISKYI